jgi:hypothetical protein
MDFVCMLQVLLGGPRRAASAQTAILTRAEGFTFDEGFERNGRGGGFGSGLLHALALGVSMLHALPAGLDIFLFFLTGGVCLHFGFACALGFLLLLLSRIRCWIYFLFSLTPVRGGTYFLCCAKESKQRKAL